MEQNVDLDLDRVPLLQQQICIIEDLVFLEWNRIGKIRNRELGWNKTGQVLDINSEWEIRNRELGWNGTGSVPY